MLVLRIRVVFPVQKNAKKLQKIANRFNYLGLRLDSRQGRIWDMTFPGRFPQQNGKV